MLNDSELPCQQLLSLACEGLQIVFLLKSYLARNRSVTSFLFALTVNSVAMKPGQFFLIFSLQVLNPCCLSRKYYHKISGTESVYYCEAFNFSLQYCYSEQVLWLFSTQNMSSIFLSCRFLMSFSCYFKIWSLIIDWGRVLCLALNL